MRETAETIRIARDVLEAKRSAVPDALTRFQSRATEMQQFLISSTDRWQARETLIRRLSAELEEEKAARHLLENEHESLVRMFEELRGSPRVATISSVEPDHSQPANNDSAESFQTIHEALLLERHRRFDALHKYVLLRGGIRIILRPRFGTPSPNIIFDGQAQQVQIDNKVFRFDRVLAPTDDNEKLWTDEIEPVVTTAVAGANVTLFAYGQTGTGKTYTMSEHSHSLIPRAFHKIFQEKTQMEQDNRQELTVALTCIEVGHGKIARNLLDPGQTIAYDKRPGTNRYGPVHKESGPKSSLRDVEPIVVNTAAEAIDLFVSATAHRSTRDMTRFGGLNATSSRSHAICVIHLVRNVNGQRLTNYVQLVDLAGSEKVIVDNPDVKEEGIAINSSLSHLVSVLSKLRAKNAAQAQMRTTDVDIFEGDWSQQLLTKALQAGLYPSASTPTVYQQPVIAFIATMYSAGHESESRSTCRMAGSILDWAEKALHTRKTVEKGRAEVQAGYMQDTATSMHRAAEVRTSAGGRQSLTPDHAVKTSRLRRARTPDVKSASTATPGFRRPLTPVPITPTHKPVLSARRAMSSHVDSRVRGSSR